MLAVLLALVGACSRPQKALPEADAGPGRQGAKPQRVQLSVRLLGDVAVRAGSQPVPTFESSRLQSLVAFLVLHRDAPQPRERLAYLLWPDSTEVQARTNLRKALFVLRQAVPAVDRCLEIEHRTLQWRQDAPADVDVVAFEDALASAEKATSRDEARDALERAVSAYGGDLLPACYEDWVLPERARLRAQAVTALERLSAEAETDDAEAALRYGEQLLRVDPVHEATYRRLMRLLAQGGERARALRTYHACESVLERELGVEPSEPTRTLYEALVREVSPTGTVELTGPRPATPSPLVGRSEEWQRLRATWRAADDGRPHALVVTGEPGVGKTRLLEELARVAATEGATVVRARAYEVEGTLAWAPVIDWLRSGAVRPRLDILAPVWLAEVGRLLPELRSTHRDLPEPAPLQRSEQRAYLFEAVARAVKSADEPLMLVIDDLQWCDDDTVEFVHFLLRHDPRARLLFACTARLEEVTPDRPPAMLLNSLRREGLLDEVSLARLGEPATVELARQLSGRAVDARTGGWLYRDTQGNPHFVVEAVRSGLSASRTGVSSTVQALLQARLDQLSPEARTVVEVAAVIGHAFSYELLAATLEGPTDRVVGALDELWRRRIIKEQGLAYDFDHDKMRDVAYGMISPARRRRLHNAVARGLSRVHSEQLGPVSGRLAVHYEQAGLARQAVVAHLEAAEHALHVLAMDDTLTEVRRALALVEELPTGQERDELELRIRMVEAVPIVIRAGYADPAAQRTYQRAFVLARGLGQPIPTPALRGLAGVALASCRLDQARRLAEQLLVAGDEEPAALVEGHYVLGVTAHWTADFAAAHHHLSAALERYRPSLGAAHRHRFAQDPAAVCRSRLGWVMWCLGRPEQGIATIREAVASARRLGHPLTSAYVGWSTALFALEAGEVQLLRETVDENLAHWDVNAMFSEVCPALFGGWLQVSEGDRRGLDTLRRAVQATRRQPNALHHVPALVAQARASLSLGAPTEAQASLGEARDAIDSGGQRYYGPEVVRLEGEVAAALGHGDRAERILREALDAAASQSSKAYTLRAASSLARLRPGTENVACLREVLESFEEGHRSADLREAAALLGQPT